jgi:hypothetical protein
MENYMNSKSDSTALINPQIFQEAVLDSFRKLTPRQQWKNPVMFVVYIGSLLTTLLWIQAVTGEGDAPAGFILAVTLWLWFTVLFANFAEAVAEGRSKAQAAFLRSAKRDIAAKKLDEPHYGANYSKVAGSNLRRGDVVLIEAGDFIPGDGDVIEGVASVDESAITGESAPVIRESGGDFSSVTGGTRVLSDWLVVRISVNPGEAFLDRMIAMVESAKRDCLDHFAGGADINLSNSHRHSAAFLNLCSWNRWSGNSYFYYRIGCFAGLSDSNDYRRLAFSNRRGRYRPYDAEKCDRNLWPGRGSRRRYRCFAARQDRHHHAGQSSGSCIYSGQRRNG